MSLIFSSLIKGAGIELNDAEIKTKKSNGDEWKRRPGGVEILIQPKRGT